MGAIGVLRELWSRRWVVAIAGVLSGKPIRGRITLSGYEGSELLVARLRWVLLFGFGIAFFQQATGINAIFYYLPTIFAQAGGELATAFGQSVFVGLVNLGMTFVAIWLVDRLGRRPLLRAQQLLLMKQAATGIPCNANLTYQPAWQRCICCATDNDR